MGPKSVSLAALLLLAAALQAEPTAVIHTTAGDIIVELDVARAPVTAGRFVDLAREGAYDNTIFHRVIMGFMVQAGGHLADLSPVAERESIVSEADNGLKNVRGSLAMARLDDIDSASMQFFINVDDNAHLDHGPGSCTREEEAKLREIEARGLYKPRTCGTFGYTVFGHVTGGMDVVDDIEFADTREAPGFESLPLDPVVIERISVESSNPKETIADSP